MIAPFLPMLAVPGEPFDSDEHLFEVKWDGVRALAAVKAGSHRLWGREQADYTPRYPELTVLRKLPAGTVVDGELVVFRNGQPQLEAILQRHQLTARSKIDRASRQCPVSYVLFDLLYWQGRPLLKEPLAQRRERLQEMLGRVRQAEWLFSEGIVGAGRRWFEQVVAAGQEGVMAKHLASSYLPGRRVPAWRKIKPVVELSCVIIGYLPGSRGPSALLVAAPENGRLRYVGKLSQGISPELRASLATMLAERTCREPTVPCTEKAVWVRPELVCEVRCLGRTGGGHLRSPRLQSFLGVRGSWQE